MNETRFDEIPKRVEIADDMQHQQMDRFAPFTLRRQNEPSPISEVVASRVKQWIAKSFRWRLSKWKASLSSSAVLLSSFLLHEMTARRKRWTSSPRQTVWLLSMTLLSNRRMDRWCSPLGRNSGMARTASFQQQAKYISPTRGVDVSQ